MTHLEEHTWPGNVRELKNVAERVALRYVKAWLEAIRPDLPLY
jgi:DNA-binding NtrC family response regulator